MKATKKEFHDYLNSLGLFRIRITEDHSAFEAILTKSVKPKSEHFSQVWTDKEGFPNVRLRFKDIQNEAITKGFFNNQLNEAKS